MPSERAARTVGSHEAVTEDRICRAAQARDWAALGFPKPAGTSH